MKIRLVGRINLNNTILNQPISFLINFVFVFSFEDVCAIISHLFLELLMFINIFVDDEIIVALDLHQS